MSATRTDDKVKLEFVINGEPARKALNDLDTEVIKLKQDIKGMKKGSEEYIAANKRLAEVTNEQAKLRKEIGLTDLSLRELNSESRRLRAIRDNLTPGTAKFEEVDNQLKLVNARMRELRNGSQQAGVSLSAMANGFNKYIGVVAGVTASFAGIIMGARKAVDEFNNFEQRLANLSALTGLVGEDMQWLGQEAATMATSTIEGNVRIRQSADAILDAYTKVGSQRPELLKNKELLAAVTQDALILAEAGNMELAPAVSAVTTTLNQMNLQATESRRVINAIAAGSKAGAADIPYLTQAMEKAGTTANFMGMSVEQVVGAIETVAPYYSRAEMAGNSLDKVMLKMRATNIGFVNGVFSLDAAMAELEQRFKNGETSVDLFGIEHAKMAEILAANRHEYNRYTAAVTNSNVAIEQATTNTDTNAAKLEQARNKYKQNLRELGGLLAPVMTFSTNFFSYLMKTILEITRNWDKSRDILIALIATYVAYNAQALIAYANTIRLNAAQILNYTITAATTIAKKAATAATLLFAAAQASLAGNTTRAAAAMRMLRATMATTPWGAILAGVTAVAGALVVYFRNQNRATETQKAMNRVMDETNTEYTKQAAEIMKLSRIIENGNIPVERRKKAIEELKQIMPEYNGYLDQEGKLHQHSTKQIEKHLEALKKKMYYNALEKELQSLIEKKVQITIEITKAQEALNAALDQEADYHRRANQMAIFAGETASQYRDRVDANRKALENKEKAAKQVEEAIKTVENAYASFIETIDASITSVNNNTDAFDENNLVIEKAAELQDILKVKIADTEKAMNQLTIAARNATLEAFQTGDWSGVEDLQKKIVALKVQLDNLKADDIIVSGIVNAGGLDNFLDSFDDVDATALMEDTAERNKQFFENWKEQRLETESETNARIAQMEIDKNSQIAEEKRKTDDDFNKWKTNKEKERLKNIKQFTIDSFREITRAVADIWFMHEADKTEKALTQLSTQKEQVLSNTKLTEQQREQIEMQFRMREAQIKKQSFIRQRNAKLIEAAINTALAVTEAMPDPFRMALAGIVGAAQSAVIAAQPVPQFRKGKYRVKGRDDGRTYEAPFIGNPKTGYYPRPALFAETGGEIIIDPKTTRNIMVNYPGILSAINAVRVPQYNTGKKMPADSGNQISTDYLVNAINALNDTVNRQNAVLSRLEANGVRTQFVMTEFSRSFEEYKTTRDVARRK